MALTQTEYGKAYEFACLEALRDHLTRHTDRLLQVREDAAYHTARESFEKAEREHVADNLQRAARAASRVIFRMEPKLEFGSGTLTLVIQTDAQGIAGDVRDVVCIRGTDWSIGLSCKHNHYAVKHSRLSATIDFGSEWMGIPCSQDYFNAVVPLFRELQDMRDHALATGAEVPEWRNMQDKAERYYIPILQAFLAELRRIASVSPEVPERLIRYLLGRHDFYKVITDDRHETTKVEAINIGGTLNQEANGHHSITDVAVLRMPRRFYHMGMVPNSDNSVEIVCDEGWALKMRIHNASSKVEPSLKFDVQLVSLPQTMFTHTELW